ncbi:hypothetical protein LTR64_006375 [Lithohypha guttulata]|uniref:uncharacterized protein n=1 Tax=Lithohypha guttulata TaxID=1690604 RepID=UPI002DE12D1C|nr:hypothetical protein LTR51_001828 [Lithohypha guttulata]
MNSSNSQHAHYNFSQHTPGPPQPHWQAPPRKVGWGDPRLSSPVAPSPSSPFPGPQGYNHGPGQPPLPPPPPPPPGGFPNAAQSNATQYDTSLWGVKYNHNQYLDPGLDNALRPALPHRPPSAQAGQQTGWTSQPQQPAPPVPPPRPPQYAIPQQQPLAGQNQYYPHEQYSQRPASHHYEPSNPQYTPNRPSAPAWQQSHDIYDAPVSPIEQQQQHQHQSWQVPYTTPPTQQAYGTSSHPPPPAQSHGRYHSSSIPTTGPSALGSGGPSDWQHYPGAGEFFDDFPKRHSVSQLHPATYAPHDPHSFTVTPEQAHVIPIRGSPQSYGQGLQSAADIPRPSSQNAYQQIGSPLESPASHHGPLTERPRPDSDATTTTSTGTPARSGTIDSVMNAWMTSTSNVVPNQVVAARERPQPPSPREVSSIQTQTDFPPVVRLETKVETKIETREVDPYEDLKNEYRTSLNRYATMLRQEMATQKEQEKMKIVVDFVNREVKLRSVLFNAEPAELVRSSELAELRRTAEKVKEEEAKGVSRQARDIKRPSIDDHTTSIKPPQIDTQPDASQALRDDGFVVVDANGDDAEYSPGGRPKVPLPTRTPAQLRSATPVLQTALPKSSSPVPKTTQPPSPGSNAPMTLDDYETPDFSSINANRAPSVSPAYSELPEIANPVSRASAPTIQAPIHFQPPRPAYTPFRYADTSQPASLTIGPTNPVNQAYTKLRQDQALDSGRLLSQEGPLLAITAPDRTQSATPSRARQQQEEAFIGLLRQQSKAIRRPQTAPISDAPGPLRIGTPLKRKQSLPPMVKSFESLRQLLPTDVSQLSTAIQDHARMAPINTAISVITDDFGFIHGTVVSWDKDNRKHRAQLDKERAGRESESQSRIDELFHDNEIGYADIADLEEDFKVEEAGRKYQEDQDELESFTHAVFETVTNRLEKELAELETLRVKVLDILDLEAQSASGIIRENLKGFNNAMVKASLTDAMSTMLQIFDKIEIRQKKVAEAHFERERRRKRLELTILYTNGDTAGVKKLEKDFDRAQAMQVLSEARKRDERANRLMDSFDRAVVRGLAENQEWIDEVSDKASLLRDIVLGSKSNGPPGQDRDHLLYGQGGIKETVDLLHDAVAMVDQDSKELIRLSSHADKTLNEADFAMFLAEATIADADKKEFEKLYNEKVKEDQKLKDEAEGRLSSVQRGPGEIFSYIKDIRDFIGGDKDHHVRINSALERAKQRNQSQSDG